MPIYASDYTFGCIFQGKITRAYDYVYYLPSLTVDGYIDRLSIFLVRLFDDSFKPRFFFLPSSLLLLGHIERVEIRCCGQRQF
jgi:hypothetical protein